MIENDEQLKITQEQIQRFKDALCDLPEDIAPEWSKLYRDSIQSQLDEMVGEVELYTGRKQ